MISARENGLVTKAAFTDPFAGDFSSLYHFFLDLDSLANTS
jgi:hypothetical protein